MITELVKEDKEKIEQLAKNFPEVFENSDCIFKTEAINADTLGVEQKKKKNRSDELSELY